MEQTIINHPRLKVRVETGSEGPHWDPYSYTEYHVRTPGGKTVLHEGLGDWMSFDDVKFEGCFHADLRRLFTGMVGFSVEQLERIARKLNSKCRKCGCVEFDEESGYPGETFEICHECGHIQSSRFSRSAVE